MTQLVRLLLAAALLCGGAAVAHEIKAGALQIVHPWARATPPGAKAGAGYLTIVNRGGEADRLVAVECRCAGKSMLHETKIENDVARMQHVDGVAIPAGEAVKLGPGGLHIMFMGLKSPFMEEDRIGAVLVFEKAGKVPVEFYVQGLAADEPAHGHGSNQSQ